MLKLSSTLDAFSELNDLKRIYSAGRTGSIATRLFDGAWSALVDGAPVSVVAGWITGRALAAARLGDIDEDLMLTAGLAPADARHVVAQAMDAVGGAMLAPLRRLIEAGLDFRFVQGSLGPGFVAALAQQPRAGVTCPGKPRILLEPPENHADHCLMTAVYGVLLAPRYGGDVERVFLAALSHHFHNVGLPDAGFSGEVLLGSHLEAVMAYFTNACLSELAPPLRAQVEAARSILPDADTADGRAFHAADVLDRVLQITQYARAASLTPARMLGEMELVHEGPVKSFHDDVLRQAGLL